MPTAVKPVRRRWSSVMALIIVTFLLGSVLVGTWSSFFTAGDEAPGFNYPDLADLPPVSYADSDLPYRIPRIIVDDEGIHYMVMVGTTDELTRNGDIWFTTSEDGDEWADPIQVTTSTKRDSWPILTRSAAGTLYITFSSTRDTQGIGESWDVYLIRSYDGGETWTTPTFVAGTYPQGNNPNGIEFLDGRLIVSYGMGNGLTDRQFVIISEDRGETWGTPHQITSLNIRKTGSLMMNRDEELVIAFQERYTPWFHFLVSSDGREWRDESTFNCLCDAPWYNLFQDETGLYWLAWQMGVGNGPVVGKFTIWYSTSPDLQNWSDPQFAAAEGLNDITPHFFPGPDSTRLAWASLRESGWRILFRDLDDDESEQQDVPDDPGLPEPEPPGFPDTGVDPPQPPVNETPLPEELLPPVEPELPEPGTESLVPPAGEETLPPALPPPPIPVNVPPPPAQLNREDPVAVMEELGEQPFELVEQLGLDNWREYLEVTTRIVGEELEIIIVSRLTLEELGAAGLAKLIPRDGEPLTLVLDPPRLFAKELENLVVKLILQAPVAPGSEEMVSVSAIVIFEEPKAEESGETAADFTAFPALAALVGMGLVVRRRRP